MQYITELYLHWPSFVAGLIASLLATTIVLLIERINQLSK